MKDEMVLNEYRDFIKGIELQKIHNSRVLCKIEEGFAPPASLNISDKAIYKKINPNNLEIKINYILTATKNDSEKPGMIIEADFILIYKTEKEMSDKLMKIFKDSSLRIQVWPYFRELVHHMSLYMGVPPLVLDVVKIRD